MLTIGTTMYIVIPTIYIDYLHKCVIVILNNYRDYLHIRVIVILITMKTIYTL
jgi:hypothetical protein